MVSQLIEEVNDIEDDAPKTLSAQQEIFCQQFAQHGDFWRAYQVAGYTPDPVNPRSQKAKFLTNPKLKNRISILRERASVKLDLDIGKIIQMTVDVYERSMDTGRLDVALGATKFLGDYLGMQTPGKTNININLSGDKLEGEIVRLAKAAGVKLVGTSIKDADFTEVIPPKVQEEIPTKESA